MNTSRFLAATGNPEGSCCPSMAELDDTALAVLLEALTDRKAHRRLIGQLRPRLVVRSHHIAQLPRCSRPGLLALSPARL